MCLGAVRQKPNMNDPEICEFSENKIKKGNLPPADSLDRFYDAEDGSRTRERLHDQALNLAPLTTRQPPQMND